MNKSRKWKGNTGGNLVGQRALIAFFRLLDVRAGYAVMAAVVPFYMLFARKACNAIYRFFRLRIGLSKWKAFIGAYKNHFVFGQIILDRFAVFAGKQRFFETEIIGNEHFRRLVAGDKGFVIAGAHVGNFEICGYLLNPGKKRINALIYPGETKTVQQNRAKRLTPHNINLIPVDADMSHLFAINNALRNGEIVSMPCDRNLGSAKTVACDFLDATASFPLGPFALAANFDVEIIAIFAVKRSSRKYTVCVMPVTPDPQDNAPATKRQLAEQYARSYAKTLETVVRQYPSQWFNYYEFWQ
jgi:predicted LPLAT superfamily acyltransferase